MQALDSPRIDRLKLPVSDARPFHLERYAYGRPTQLRYDVHYAVEVGVVLKGKMFRRWQETERILGVGDCWTCGIWEPHGWSVLEAPCEVALVFGLPQMLAAQFFPEAPNLVPLDFFALEPARRHELANAGNGRMLDWGRAIEEELGAPTSLGPRSLFLRWLALLPAEDFPEKNRPYATEDARACVNEAITWVFRTKRHVTVDEVADRCGMTRQTFSRLFRSMMGMSFSNFALAYRLSEAVLMLRQHSATLQEAAEEWGFTDASHLHRCIGRVLGTSPREFREGGEVRIDER